MVRYCLELQQGGELLLDEELWVEALVSISPSLSE